MTTSDHDCSPDLTAQRVQVLRDYFAKTTDIGRVGIHGDTACMCSMEHINFALDSVFFPADFDADGSYEAHVFPHGQVAGLQSMSEIIVAFNDATPVGVLSSDAWRLGLLPRLLEADSSVDAVLERLQMIRDWLAKHGFTFKGQLCLNGGSDGHDGASDRTLRSLYALINFDVRDCNFSILEALGISAEDYICFLRTLINPLASREPTTPPLDR